MVTTIAGVEILLNPRTAWTRSSSPGPDRTTRASSTTPPTHTAIASAWRTPITHTEPGERSDGAGDSDHRSGEPGDAERGELGRGVDDAFGSERRPCRGEQEHEAQQHGAAGPPGIDEIEPGARIEGTPTAVGGDRCCGEAREQARCRSMR